MGSRLTILVNEVDDSKDLSKFLNNRDVAVSLTAGQYLHIGYHKPINQIYAYLATPSVSASSATVEYYNGSTWVEVENLDDDTYGLSKSGYISWDQFSNSNNKFEATTIGSHSDIYFRISFDSNITCSLSAMGMIFSEDQDILDENPNFSLPQFKRAVYGEDEDLMRVHVSVRDQIVNDLRANGIRKYNADSGRDESLRFFRSVNEFDLFKLEEVHYSAKMLAMSKLYYKLRDEDGDKWDLEASRYQSLYNESMNIAFMSIDINDDGILDEFENLKSIVPITMKR